MHALSAVIGIQDPARQDRAIGLQTLADHDQAELIQAAERGQPLWLGGRMGSSLAMYPAGGTPNMGNGAGVRAGHRFTLCGMCPI